MFIVATHSVVTVRGAPACLKLVAPSTLTFTAVLRPSMFGKRWRVNGFARFIGGVDVFVTCTIPQAYRIGPRVGPKMLIA